MGRMRHFLIALTMAAAFPVTVMGQEAASSLPETAQAVAQTAEPRPATIFVRLQTSDGPIVLELEEERAPQTVSAFLKNVDGKRYDGGNFYRALNMAEDFGLIQGGIAPLKPGQKLPPTIPHEPTSQTGLVHRTGTISMARAEPGSARTDFFITVGNMSSLDAHPDQPGDNLGFAAFGKVVEGMDVVLKIMRSPISPTLGEKEGMKGQMLAAPVIILSARRSLPPKAAPTEAGPGAAEPAAAPMVRP
ncbi:MAG: peptidylprolyl isomerase [Sphingomonadales bacterium]|nr:MAG: peptidylprolyl isomerase [Sphingomonadales bacterium]TNF03939.1 MAG: peptidylprolyl isomerase [Sphingomonadales bacterium]